ncbi:HlyD family type I secretion periplasmic adaptor subunit [Rhodovulum sp. 12E13]|uniref:HlyD family type I secretion periplasmic adaptor subunit n=1 Tax=Rhodovulum sp. 12E13 TaxID=2203891 RepID=UPI0013140D7E|nr:HlyD family type I secretion periplasmic adaptor subunit [Rhodovulum sp. 12E13]
MTLFGFAIVFLTFGVFGVWAAVAKIDSAVIAPGVISLEGNRKVVQHLEGGIVEEIHVAEADSVDEGDLLLRLSSVEARSNLEVVRTRLDLARIVEARLLAERSSAEEMSLPDHLAESERPGIREVIDDQLELFVDRRSLLQSRVEILDARIDQTHEQIAGLEQQRDALERRLANYREMVDRMTEGSQQGLVQTNLVSQRQDELIQIEADLGRVISEIATAKTTISETELQRLQATQEYRERANSELEEIRSQISEFQERMKVAQDVLTRTEVRAPDSGTIQNLKVHTVGAVIRPGDVLMELVPEDERLIINARVAPIDADNVFPGMEAEVRFTAFKARLTPFVLGTVESVSNDVIEPQNPQEAPYFLARVHVADEDIEDDVQARLTAGMPADVVVTGGERSVLTYLSAPLMDAVRKSMTEE